MKQWLNARRDVLLIVALFVAFRLMWLMAYPPSAPMVFGDYQYYYDLARLAGQGHWPFTGYWMEYPPVFAYLLQYLYVLVGDNYTAFATALGVVMLAFEAGNVVLVYRLASFAHSSGEYALKLTWVYGYLFIPTLVVWHNNDVIPTFFLLLAADEYLRGRSNRSAVWLGLGTMSKFFPIVLLPVIWRFRRSVRSAVTYTAIAGAICLLMIVPLLVASPTYAIPSLRALFVKSSWQTVWALLDGNLTTGLFGQPASVHLDPAMATLASGNPARIPLSIPLLAFGLLYSWLWLKTPTPNSSTQGGPHVALDFHTLAAVTLVIFFLWSRGWSPQWLVMLIPFLLIVLPLGRALLYILTLSFMNLLEWPVLLSRGMNQWLYFTVPVRTLLLVMLLINLVQVMQARKKEPGKP